MNTSFNPQLRIPPGMRSKVKVVVLPPSQGPRTVPIERKINGILEFFSPCEIVELRPNAGAVSNSAYRHNGAVVEDLAALCSAIGDEVSQVLVLGGMMEKASHAWMRWDLETLVYGLMEKAAASAVFHFIDGTAAYYYGDEDFVGNVFTKSGCGRSFPPDEAKLTRPVKYWQTAVELAYHLMPEEMRANLAETALTQARRFYPASVSREPRGQPAFVTAAPLWLATAADAEKKYQAATETRLFRGCARTYNVGDYKDIGRGELVLASMEARINGVLWRPTPVHFTARLALIKTAREEGLPVKLLIPEKEEKDSPVANFIAAALALGGVETFRAIDFTPAFLPWPRNFASQVDGRILPNHNIADVLLESAAGERRPFFPSLGIDPRRVLSPSFLGSGGEALFGEDFALIPDYAAGMEGFFSGKAKNAEAWAIAKALGREGFFLPLPIIDAVSLDYRPRKKFPLAIKQRVEDLDYRILLLRKGKRIFVAQDYYDRFEAAVSAVLNQIKTRYGYQWEVVSAPFREDLNVPELPDGTVLVYQGSSPLISALQKANIPCKTVDYEPVEGNILCGSDGFLRCASNIFING